MKDYIGYSGDADGSDKYWFEIARQNNVGKLVNYYASTLALLTVAQTSEVEKAYWQAADDLGRPLISSDKYTGQLVRRDYLQAKAGEAIYVIGTIVKPGDINKAGYKVKSKTESVDGGAGYSTQMAINLEKPVFVFDQIKGRWYQWNYDHNCFEVHPSIPSLTKKFTGVGTREINSAGKAAIREIFRTTINHNI